LICLDSCDTIDKKESDKMKLLICSDIHGDYSAAVAVTEAFERQKCDKILILGDILYHGPRNSLPSGYSPSDVIKLLNGYKDRIIAVRGNCDAEVDQMVLDFPIMADYVMLELDGARVFATHGHHFNMSCASMLGEGDILLHGHTHIPANIEFGRGNLYLNPGSVSLPKENHPKTYMIYEDSCFTLYDFDGNAIFMVNC
jgi:putative phosphoesterase